VSDLAGNRDNFCYRHPDRQSFILCQRCGRTVCPQCSTQAAVGVHCPECVKEARANAPKRPPVNIRAARRLRSPRGGLTVTYVIMALMAVGYVLSLLGPAVLLSIAFVPDLTLIHPWTMLTYPFASGSVLSLLLNGLVMFFLGRQAEESLGRARFITLFLISTFAGAVAMLMFVPDGALLGSSPPIWGLFGVILIYARSQGANVTGLIVMLALFVIIGLVVGTTWQASVGGLVGGATVTTAYVRLGAVRQAREQRLAIAGIVVALVVLAVVALVI
jgi:membrane associated rhomboid family serine protease